MKKCGILVFCALFCVSMAACSTSPPPASDSSAASSSSAPSLETTVPSTDPTTAETTALTTTETVAESTTASTVKPTKEKTTTAPRPLPGTSTTDWTTTGPQTSSTEPPAQEMSKEDAYNLYLSVLAVSNFSDNTLWSQGSKLQVGTEVWISQFKQNRYQQDLSLWVRSSWQQDGLTAEQEAYFDGSSAAFRVLEPDELLNIRYPSTLEQFAADYLGGESEGENPILFFGAENIEHFHAKMTGSEIQLVIYVDPEYGTPLYMDLIKNALGASSALMKKVDQYSFVIFFNAETGMIRFMRNYFYGTCVVDGQEKAMLYEMPIECQAVTGPLAKPDWVANEIGDRPEWMG